MAAPIPTNRTGLRQRRRFHAQAYVPAWGIPQAAGLRARGVASRVPAAPPQIVRQGSRVSVAMLLLGVSGVTGGLAVISSLAPWPALAASSMGLDERGTFFLLVTGLYLLATTFYAALRTRLLRDLNQAPWDARLMAYANVGIGGAVSAALGILTLAMVAVVLLLAGLAIVLLKSAAGQSGG